MQPPLRRPSLRLALPLAALLAAAGSRAASYSVDSLSDGADSNPGDARCETAGSGPCTLRAAIQEANADTAPDVVTFDAALGLPGTITLTGGPLVITQPVTIDGPGALMLSVDAGGAAGMADRVVLVNPPAGVVPTVTFRGLTIRGGYVDAPPRQGAGVFANPDAGDAAELVFEAVTITGNEAVAAGAQMSLGGGVYLGGGMMTMTDSLVEGNSLTGANNDFAGAGIYVFDGDVLIERTTIADNEIVEGLGAGLRVRAGTTRLVDSTIRGNRTTQANGPQAWGGGAAVGTPAGTAGTLIAERSTFSGNSSDQGGGLYVVTGSATLTNCTFSGNTADCHGAAIRVQDAGTLTLNNCTIFSNAVVLNRPGCFGNGGGIFTEGGLVTLSNTIVAGNTGYLGGNPGVPNDLGTDRNRLTPNWVSANWNLIGVIDNVEGPFATQAGDQSGVPGAPLDPVLQAVLTDNGGFTLTHGPFAGSPALENGSPNNVGSRPDCQPDDQRHAVRPLDSDRDGVPLCDVGAVEGCVGPNDADGDHFGDECDNCRVLANFSQDDADTDAVGDLCDNCRTTSNPLQDDTDLDGRGEPCDNCPRDANAIHAAPVDCNGDGDALDAGELVGQQCDVDGDGAGDICDCFPNDASNPQLDPVGNLDFAKLPPSTARASWAGVTNALGYNVYRGFMPRGIPFVQGLDTLQCFDGGDTRVTTIDDPLRRREGLLFYVVSSFCIGAESVLGYTYYGDPRWPAPFVRPACPEPVRDRDGDGYQDAEDVCPLLANPGQEDTDGDFNGDACESCPLHFNPAQFDADADGIGDACDCDRDGDGFDADGEDAAGVACAPAVPDNCPRLANPLQEDGDADGVGDACDVCPLVPDPEQRNTDADECGNACDAEPFNSNAGC